MRDSDTHKNVSSATLILKSMSGSILMYGLSDIGGILSKAFAKAAM